MGTESYALITEARADLIQSARDWREAECSNNVIGSGEELGGERCVGDNHIMECPVERARGDLISSIDRLDRLEGRK